MGPSADVHLFQSKRAVYLREAVCRTRSRKARRGRAPRARPESLVIKEVVRSPLVDNQNLVYRSVDASDGVLSLALPACNVPRHRMLGDGNNQIPRHPTQVSSKLALAVNRAYWKNGVPSSDSVPK